MRRLLFLSFLFLTGSNLFATHNRAGEITYEWLGGLRYRFTIHICTNEGQAVADRPELEIWYGDGERDTVSRVSQITAPATNGFQGSSNIYIAEHTYDGPATYKIEVLDPNRNTGILNIVSSVDVAFCLRTTLVISPFLRGYNNSCVPQDFPCPEFGCVNKKYCYNSAAYDPDGDSLSYELVPCMEGNVNNNGCDPLSIPTVYQYPHQVGGGTISVDPSNGTVCWDFPTMAGEYNFAILIKEWHAGFVIGTMIRDIQVTIDGTCNNNPPTLTPVFDTCVVAGGTVTASLTATDPDANDFVFLDHYGQPFVLGTSPATFSTSPLSQPANPITGNFSWTTDCSHIRNAPYQVYFIATDNDPDVPAIDVQSMYIRVIPPSVTGLTVNPITNTMVLNWNPSTCTNLKGYKIYRKLGNGNAASGCCDQNTPTDMGYALIGTVSGGYLDTHFVDNDNLVLGNFYCYIVVAYMTDGTISCPSPEVCASLRMDVPVITNVSVGRTDVAIGIDTIRWFHPTELDTVSNFPPPYFYKVYKLNNFGNPTQLVYTSPQGALLSGTQNELIIDTLNTVNNPHTYRVELFNLDINSNPQSIGSTNNASSIFLSITPSDNQLLLSWQVQVPWTNSIYRIYKETFPGSTVFNLLDTTSNLSYTDTGLINGHTYCYRIESIGSYSEPSIPSPLFNFSQIVCSSPVDLTPPCAPTLEITNDCTIPLNTLTWNNPNNSCADDVMSYNLYFTPVEGEPFTLLFTFNSSSDTTVTHVLPNGSVAGCYYITAVDSVQYGNESVASNIVCGDNCPVYTLPNVFSPNGDGDNDLFIPFPYTFVEKIDIKIYDRWGVMLFETTDPDIRWDGKNSDSGTDVPEGVYFYTCKVYTIRTSGLVEVDLHGFIHLYRDNGGSTH